MRLLAASVSLGIVVPALGLPNPHSKALPSSVASAVPGKSSLFATYSGKAPPISAQDLKAISATGSGEPDAEEVMLQNLLGGEWVVRAFYQYAVEAFSTSSFTKLGYPNTTYRTITAMRDNKIGHARIFQEKLGKNSVKPGPCEYLFKEIVQNKPEIWLGFQLYIEISTLMAIGQTESRHNAWALSEVLKTSLLTGPSDTVYPYANQILDGMVNFTKPGSCPSLNPTFPSPRQGLATMGFNPNTTTARPGSDIELVFPNKKPIFHDKEYFAVFYHGMNNINVLYDPKQNRVKIPHEFGTDGGLVIANIADEPHAPTPEGVVAGPMFLIEQPWQLAKDFSFSNSI